jgi:hypothetical protein
MKSTTMMLAFSALSIWLSACATNSPGSGSATVDGTIRGKTFTLLDAISASYTTTASSTAGRIVLTSTANACDDTTKNIDHPNEYVINLIVSDMATGETRTAPTTPGTYTITSLLSTTPPAKAAVLYTNVGDATCGYDASLSSTANTGTVVLSAVDGDQFSGTFDVMLDSGDHVLGSFEPQACAGFKQNPASSPTCM